MKKIFNKNFLKNFNSKKNKGTTIVEVLVSVIIIGIVTMYGMSFFSSSYRFATDSKDYSLILQEMTRKMEIAKGARYVSVGINVEEGYYESQEEYIEDKFERYGTRAYPDGIRANATGQYSDRLHFDFKMNRAIRTGCTVEYTYIEYDDTNPSGTENFYGSTKIILTAEWPREVITALRNKITLVTYKTRPWNS